jgi:LacI family transcriptional regulator
VLQAIAALDYKPNAFARGLATNRSGGIGITVNEVSSPYFGAFVAGVEQVARENGIHLMVSSGFADADAERSSIEFLLGRRCDGLVVQAEGLPDEELIELVREWPRAGRRVRPRHRRDRDACVVMNNELGGALATEHLLDNGHRRIGHVTGPLSYPDARDRLQGYRRALEAAGVGYLERYVVESNFLEEGGARAVARLLERAPEITAIFFGNDQMAAGGMRALRECGRDVPATSPSSASTTSSSPSTSRRP